jgi:hypothetical protein
MKRSSKSDILSEKEDNWNPDAMIEMLESFKDRPMGRVCLFNV